MRTARRKSIWRQIRASWRDILLLLREFQRPLLIFVLAMVGFGALYTRLAEQAGEPVENLAFSIYLMISLTFLQAGSPFPHAWYLQIFYFLMPFLGIGILAQGLADFGVLLFNRRARGKEWEMAVASTYNNHVILIGLGHLGYRVVKQLHDMEQEVVVIELSPDIDLLNHVRRMDIPVIQDDGTRESALEGAGIKCARAILLCTQNDSLNLQMALKARTLNPNIQVVLRIFDDDFAQSLQAQFGFRAFSATGMAAPIFAASAANIDVTPPISIEGQPNSLARIQVGQHSMLTGLSINEVEDRYQISLVLLRRNNQSELHPAGANTIQKGDTLAFFGSPENINRLVHHNNK